MLTLSVQWGNKFAHALDLDCNEYVNARSISGTGAELLGACSLPSLRWLYAVDYERARGFCGE